MSPFALRASIAITLGVAVGVSLTCSPRVSIGDNIGEPLVIGYIPKSYDNPVFKQAYLGARRAAADLQRRSGRRVAIQLYDPSSLDVQQFMVRTAINDGMSGLLVSCANDAVSSSIDEADSKGIPVITFDSDCPRSNRLGFFGTANEDAGMQAAELLVQAMDGGVEGKSVAILTGQDAAVNLNERIVGFNKRLGTKDQSLTVMAPFHCDEMRVSCSQMLDDVVKEHQDLAGVFVVGQWGVQGACSEDCSSAVCECPVETSMPNWNKATKSSGLKTVAFDAWPFELKLMQDGYLSALIGQKYYDWGYCTTTRMFRHLTQPGTRRDKVEFPASGYDVIDDQVDVEEMIARWRAVETDEINGTLSAEPPECGDAGL